MVAFACGVTAALFDAGIRPDYVAGLSLGEYSALEASGVFAAKAAIELAAYRGAAMASASEGVSSAMTAVLDARPRIAGALLRRGGRHGAHLQLQLSRDRLSSAAKRMPSPARANWRKRRAHAVFCPCASAARSTRR